MYRAILVTTNILVSMNSESYLHKNYQRNNKVAYCKLFLSSIMSGYGALIGLVTHSCIPFRLRMMGVSLRVYVITDGRWDILAEFSVAFPT